MGSLLVVAGLWNPFDRRPRVRYVHGFSGVVAGEAFAALLDPELYPDSRAIVFVADVFSVWPEAGVFPHASLYREVIEGFSKVMPRRCEAFAPPSICGRVGFKVFPWWGVKGGWLFDARPQDAGFAILAELLEFVADMRPSRIVVVSGGWRSLPGLDPIIQRASTAAAAGLSAQAAVEVCTVIAEEPPFPFPRRGQPELDIVELACERYSPDKLTRSLLSLQPPESMRPYMTRGRMRLEQRKVLERGAKQLEELVLHAVATYAAIVHGLPLLYAYEACGVPEDPLKLLAKAAKAVLEAYVDSTTLAKKAVGGTVGHPVTLNYRLLEWLAHVYPAANRKLLPNLDKTCEELYTKGLTLDQITEILRRLSPHVHEDPTTVEPRATPPETLQPLADLEASEKTMDNRLKLSKKILNTLRRKALQQITTQQV